MSVCLTSRTRPGAVQVYMLHAPCSPTRHTATASLCCAPVHYLIISYSPISPATVLSISEKCNLLFPCHSIVHCNCCSCSLHVIHRFSLLPFFTISMLYPRETGRLITSKSRHISINDEKVTDVAKILAKEFIANDFSLSGWKAHKLHPQVLQSYISIELKFDISPIL